MIQILPKILRGHSTATLVIACPPGKYQTTLHNLAVRLNVASSTRIMSPTSLELNALYSAADVVVFPSQAHENAPRAVLEAMRFGVPPVVWDNGWGATDFVKDGLGYRARPYDLSDFLDKILTLLNDRDMRDKMGRSARSAAEKYSWANVGPVFENILRQAALQ
jgi:glycosyltransferase involved in cell wall biosynthesis